MRLPPDRTVELTSYKGAYNLHPQPLITCAGPVCFSPGLLNGLSPHPLTIVSDNDGESVLTHLIHGTNSF